MIGQNERALLFYARALTPLEETQEQLMLLGDVHLNMAEIYEEFLEELNEKLSKTGDSKEQEEIKNDMQMQAEQAHHHYLAASRIFRTELPNDHEMCQYVMNKLLYFNTLVLPR